MPQLDFNLIFVNFLTITVFFIIFYLFNYFFFMKKIFSVFMLRKFIHGRVELRLKDLAVVQKSINDGIANLQLELIKYVQKIR